MSQVWLIYVQTDVLCTHSDRVTFDIKLIGLALNGTRSPPPRECFAFNVGLMSDNSDGPRQQKHTRVRLNLNTQICTRFVTKKRTRSTRARACAMSKCYLVDLVIFPSCAPSAPSFVCRPRLVQLLFSTVFPFFIAGVICFNDNKESWGV